MVRCSLSIPIRRSIQCSTSSKENRQRYRTANADQTANQQFLARAIIRRFGQVTRKSSLAPEPKPRNHLRLSGSLLRESCIPPMSKPATELDDCLAASDAHVLQAQVSKSGGAGSAAP